MRWPKCCGSEQPVFVPRSRERGPGSPISCGVVALVNKMEGGASMSKCEQESIIVAALASGELPEQLRLHLAGCAVCREVHSVAGKMLQFANELGEELRPSAGSMWWRLNLRMRQEQARRAQAPLIWMTRILYFVAAVTSGLLVASVPGVSRPAAAIGLVALSVLVLPVAIMLWGWSRWKI